jgi:hypothetical protein
MEFDSIDPVGTAFRYADDQMRTLSHAECWVDFVQLRYAMDLVFGMLDGAILRVGASGRRRGENERSGAAKLEISVTFLCCLDFQK